MTDQLIKKIKDEKIYEKIVFDNDVDKDMILDALEIVKLFIIKKKRVLVGGMAIDYALKKKEKKLYDENTLPDYDFFTPQFHHDAYDIANELSKSGLKKVSVINAYHASTMRVRVKFHVVADCTYIPEKIYEGLPRINYENFVVVHPHYQMLNQHLSLGRPYHGAPWETIQRWKKDIKRFNILDREYPIDDKFNEKQKSIDNYQEFSFNFKDTNDLCLDGFGAVLYWLDSAKKDGYVPDKEFEKLGSFNSDGHKAHLKIPVANLGDMGTLGLSLSCDRRIILEHPYLKKIADGSKQIRRFNAFLDLIPRRILIDGNYEIMENRGHMISAYKDKMYISNMQVLLKYFLLNYMVSFNILKQRDGYCFYLAYKLAYSLCKWAADTYKKTNSSDMLKYLPTQDVFGKHNWSETYISQRKIFQATLGKIKRIQHTDKPRPAYIDQEEDYPIDPEKYKFDPTQSEIYQFDYEEHKGPFEPVFLYDPVIDNEP